MKITKFDLPFGYVIMNNNKGVYISSGVVTPSIMDFKICKAKS